MDKSIMETALPQLQHQYYSFVINFFFCNIGELCKTFSSIRPFLLSKDDLIKSYFRYRKCLAGLTFF